MLDRNFNKFLSWVLVAIVMIVLGLLIRVPLLITRRVRVRGRKNLVGMPKNNVLFIANHPSYLDPFFIPFALCWPQVLLFLYQAPWQAADKHNLGMHKPLLHFILSHLYCVPVDRRGGTQGLAMRSLLEKLPKARLLIFPEGTRSGKAEQNGVLLCRTKNGLPIGAPKPGVGQLIQDCNPHVVPILVRGTAEIMPVGAHFPGFLKNFMRNHAEVIIGKPQQADLSIRFMGKSDRQKQLMYSKEALERVMKLDS
jgi:1-acyl-sn-glycerol-3-phosphate acyltransferase